MRILIANRGEIARRVIRTAKRLGHETVAVYAEPDTGAPFTAEADRAELIGPATLAESYLSTERPQSCLLGSIRLLLRHPHLAAYELQGRPPVYQRAPREDRTAGWTLPLGVGVRALSTR